MKALGIISGILMCILGGCAMAMPFRVFLGMGWLVGTLFLVYGVQTAVEAMKREKKDWLACILGVLTAILGIWTILSAVQRVLTDMMIAYLVGFNLIMYGVLRCIAAYKFFKAGEKTQGVITILCAILTLVCGVFAVGHPIMTMISVGYIIAINLVVQGISMVVMSCTIKKEK